MSLLDRQTGCSHSPLLFRRDSYIADLRVSEVGIASCQAPPLLLVPDFASALFVGPATGDKVFLPLSFRLQRALRTIMKETGAVPAILVQQESYTKLGSRYQQASNGGEGLKSTASRCFVVPTPPRSPPAPKFSNLSHSASFPVVRPPSPTLSRSGTSLRQAGGVERFSGGSLEDSTRMEREKDTTTAQETKNGRRRGGLPKFLQSLRPKAVQHKIKTSSENNTPPAQWTTFPASISASNHGRSTSPNSQAPSPKKSSTPSSSTAFPPPPSSPHQPQEARLQLRPPLVHSHSEPSRLSKRQQWSAPSSFSWRGRIVGSEGGAQLLESRPIEDYRFPPLPQSKLLLESTPRTPSLPPAQALPVPVSPLVLPAPRSSTAYQQPGLPSDPQDDFQSAILSRVGGRRDSFSSFSQSSLALSEGLTPLPEVSHWSTTDSTGSSSGESRRLSLPLTEEENLASLPLGAAGLVLKSKFSDWTLSTHHSSLASYQLSNPSNPSLAASASSSIISDNLSFDSAMEHLVDSPSSPFSQPPTKSVAVQTDPTLCPDCATLFSSWGDEETTRGPRLGGGRLSVSQGVDVPPNPREEMSIKDALTSFEDGGARAELRRRLLEAGLDGRGGWGGSGSHLHGREEMDREAREERVRLLEDETEWRIESFRRAGDIIARL
ncbi:hypothetical protein BCR35DRAFT_327016 [Leucosporidium creatinivorum]|uniref:Uncharacterized protein n=1 Tax=Leucosporidium creatinivorum TaxID=106004 RepID=A0A1Y2D8Y4_9BASI|nr:hypothetical protein BCR35DRAFT_327016 [Leucosporidium creatinivorum]